MDEWIWQKHEYIEPDCQASMKSETHKFCYNCVRIVYQSLLNLLDSFELIVLDNNMLFWNDNTVFSGFFGSLQLVKYFQAEVLSAHSWTLNQK